MPVFDEDSVEFAGNCEMRGRIHAVFSKYLMTHFAHHHPAFSWASQHRSCARLGGTISVMRSSISIERRCGGRRLRRPSRALTCGFTFRPLP